MLYTEKSVLGYYVWFSQNEECKKRKLTTSQVAS